MTLQQLLDAMNAAKAAMEAKPEDASLKTAFETAKTAYETAKAAAEAGEGGEGAAGPDESSWDDKTKAYIARLRGENAKHRTEKKSLKENLTQSEAQKKAILKAAGIELEDEGDPAERLQASQSQAHLLTFRNAILETALENGIAKEDVDYFSYLVEKRTAELGEGEELTDEAMAQLVQDVRKRGAGKGNTSVGGKGKEGGSGNPPNPEGGQGEVTLDKFVRMSMGEKMKLYATNPELYNSLLKAARETNRLV